MPDTITLDGLERQLICKALAAYIICMGLPPEPDRPVELEEFARKQADALRVLIKLSISPQPHLAELLAKSDETLQQLGAGR